MNLPAKQETWAGKSPGEGNDNPPQCSCLENPIDRGTLQSIWWQKAQKDCATNTHIPSLHPKEKGFQVPEGPRRPSSGRYSCSLALEVNFERDAKGKEQSRDMGTLLSSDVMTYIKKECDVNSALRYRI